MSTGYSACFFKFFFQKVLLMNKKHKLISGVISLEMDIGDWRNEKFQLEITVWGPRVNERHRCYKASSYLPLKGLGQCNFKFLSLRHFWV